MSNKNVVTAYMDAFSVSDYSKILSCLTDDVVWLMPGYFDLKGKEAFDKEVKNEAFVGNPNILVTRLIEEGDFVVAEGTVTSQFKTGGMLNAVFCDVFQFENGKIKMLTSYVMERKAG